MRENLFKFATKELSQDAFIAWLISNYNDPTIGKYSLAFINFLTGFSFRENDIKRIEIKQQDHDMDILVKFWTTKKEIEEPNNVLVVEDKAHSSLHSNQLVKYGQIISGWYGDGANVAKVFYKADFLSPKDEEELENAKSYKWKKYGIEEIYNHFKQISTTGSEVLDYYAEYITNLYGKMHEAPEGEPKSWDMFEARTYFRSIRDKLIKEGKADLEHIYETIYQGRYYSIAFEFAFKNKKENCRICPQIEFIFRDGDEVVKAYTHFSFLNYNDGKEEWSWKLSACRNEKVYYENVMQVVVDTFKEENIGKIRNYFAKTNQTLTVEEIVKDNNLGKNVISAVTKFKGILDKADKLLGERTCQ